MHGHLGTMQKCPDYQGVMIFQVSLCTKGLLYMGPQLSVWITHAGILIFKCPH